MITTKSQEIFRNMGFWSETFQQAIIDTKVAIGGQGGAGYLYGLELARIGVQNFTIADPEVFERVNGNRVLGVNEMTIGRNKAEVFAEDIHKFNPDANITVYDEGITEDNIEEFAHDSDLILNATELSMPELGTMIARQARKNGVPVLDIEYIGYAAQVTSFHPDSKTTFEKFMGIQGGESVPIDEVRDQKIDTSRFLAYLPPYADMKTLLEVQAGASLPSNMLGAGQATQLGIAETLKHIRLSAGLNGPNPVFAPKVRWYDPYSGESGTSSHPRTSYYTHLARVVLRNKILKNNENASYSKEERLSRGDN